MSCIKCFIKYLWLIVIIYDLGISKVQYQHLIMAAESLDRLTKAMPYRKYRPILKEYKGHYKEWYYIEIGIKSYMFSLIFCV